MWTKLDDGLLDHRKMLEAGRLLGKDGRAKALGFFTASLLYSSKHLTDGRLTPVIVDQILQIPRDGVRALVASGLWTKVKTGWVIHDYLEWNAPAADVMAKRKQDRERKRRGGKNRHDGNGEV